MVHDWSKKRRLTPYGAKIAPNLAISQPRLPVDNAGDDCLKLGLPVPDGRHYAIGKGLLGYAVLRD